ncbi:MAG: porin family protein [Nitrospirae bacterium]|nr:porin family protein [Nitrospirota bacterium]
MIIQTILLLLLMSGASHAALAGPVEIQSIQIVPTETTIGKHPEITGSIKANKDNKPGETVGMIVIAAVVLPDHVVKSWTWKKVNMNAGEIRSFTIPREYDMKSAGAYKVDFNVYSRGMSPLHSLSKTFVAVDPSLPPEKTVQPEVNVSRTRVIPSDQEDSYPMESRHLGLGVCANTVNGSGGATVILWPFTSVGFQGSYTVGSFTIAEARLLVRSPRPSGINPYLGVGYLNVTTERSVEVIDVKTNFKGSGVSGVIGAEIPLSNSLFGYVEISGASIDLKKEVTSGSVAGTASVKYAPVTIGIGVVYFLF